MSLKVVYEVKTHTRGVEQALANVQRDIRNTRGTSPIARAIRRQARSIAQRKNRREQSL